MQSFVFAEKIIASSKKNKAVSVHGFEYTFVYG